MLLNHGAIADVARLPLRKRDGEALPIPSAGENMNGSKRRSLLVLQVGVLKFDGAPSVAEEEIFEGDHGE